MMNVGCLLFILSLKCSLLIFVNSAYAQSSGESITKDQVEQFLGEESHYSIIKPLIYYKRQKQVENVEQWSHHPKHITILLPINNKELTLDLTRNTHLVSKGDVQHIQENRNKRVQKLPPKKLKLCRYRGKVRNKPKSWVVVSTCDGLSGVIYDGTHEYNIEKMENGKHNKHIIYSHHSKVKKHKIQKKLKREKRNSVQISIPSNSNADSRYIELLLVVDNGKYKEMNENIKEVEEYCKNVTSILNGIFSPLNIFAALVGVVVWVEKDEIDLPDEGDVALANFLRYRRKKLNRLYPNDNAQLLTKSVFADRVIGKSLRKTICSSHYSGGIVSGSSSDAEIVASRIARLLGNNLGIERDDDLCECPDDICIMNRTLSSSSPKHWSQCSKNAIPTLFERGFDHCLRNKPVSLFQGPVCGNGFLEDGEECDCGLPEYCTNSCCDPNTCRLQMNATCATGECCDSQTCSFKKPGTVCRQTSGECDLYEYCTGDGEFCPPDVYKMDAESCDSGRAYCFQGRCTTRDDQCKLLWGPSGSVGNEHCYTLNNKGSKFGNCGYDRSNNTYHKCTEEDLFCGLLHCQHNQIDNDLKYGLEETSDVAVSFVSYKDAILYCKVANLDLGLSEFNPGMVPNGASCGVDKMCVNQKCVSVGSLRKHHTCPHNCYNNGWCNNLGHCHCKPGYLLPYCQYFPPGGSVDSGPPSMVSL